MMKDVDSCVKLRGAAKQAVIRRCPNGKTHYSEPVVAHDEYIVVGSEPRELKHLSTSRKINQMRFP